MTTLTPPPPAPAQPAPPAGSPGPNAASRAVAIIAMVLGGCLILGTVTIAALGTILGSAHRTQVLTAADASGVNALQVRLEAGQLDIEYTDVSEPRLEAETTAAGDWTLRVDGSTLVVSSPNTFFGWSGLFGGGLKATLQLPQSLEGVDAAFTVDAGDLTTNGSFGSVNVDLSAGAAHVNGSASDLVAKVSAGRVDLDLADVETAELNLSAGTMDAVLRGTQPRSTKVDVSAGSLTLALPMGDYHVTSDVSAGSFDNRIGDQPDASSTVDVQVSAGSVSLDTTR